MAILNVVTTNGEEATLNVQAIIAIDGKPYSDSQPSDAGLERRVSVLEQLVLTLLGDKSLLPQPQKVSCSAESQSRPSSEAAEATPAMPQPVPLSEPLSSLDASQV